MHKTLLLVVSIMLSLTLVACGQKGDLYLPQDQNSATEIKEQAEKDEQ